MVLIYLADGFEELEALSVVDVLRRADLSIQMVSITGKKEVTSSHGVTITADLLFEEADHQKAQMLVLPGGMPGTLALAAHGALHEQLKQAEKDGRWLAAVCAAPTVLGSLGILQGKNAVCYPGNEAKLIGANTAVEGKVVVDGKIVTSRGPGTSLDFALELVALLKDKETSAAIRKAMIFDNP